jgi:hypothetical protein
MSQLFLHPIAPLAAYSLVATVLLCAYPLAGAADADGFFSVVFAVMVLLWMDADARRLRRVPCFDFGLLAWITFPLSTLWYCFWSRGWRGIFVLLILLVLLLGPFIVANAWRMS